MTLEPLPGFGGIGLVCWTVIVVILAAPFVINLAAIANAKADEDAQHLKQFASRIGSPASADKPFMTAEYREGLVTGESRQWAVWFGITGHRQQCPHCGAQATAVSVYEQEKRSDGSLGKQRESGMVCSSCGCLYPHHRSPQPTPTPLIQQLESGQSLFPLFYDVK